MMAGYVVGAGISLSQSESPVVKCVREEEKARIRRWQSKSGMISTLISVSSAVR
jgi:hypothetical protein